MYDLLRDSTFAEGEERELSIAEDKGQLRQDRYPLRTAPQFIGPQVETVLTALDIVTQECNSSE
jgi:phenylalanine ammonia-lyase